MCVGRTEQNTHNFKGLELGLGCLSYIPEYPIDFRPGIPNLSTLGNSPSLPWFSGTHRPPDELLPDLLHLPPP